jgi:hypothetical protein
MTVINPTDMQVNIWIIGNVCFLPLPYKSEMYMQLWYFDGFNYVWLLDEFIITDIIENSVLIFLRKDLCKF